MSNAPSGDTYDYFGGLVEQISGFQLFDGYIGKGLRYGYSVARKLVSTPLNNRAFRGRRSSDDTEADFGYVNNLTDTAALLAAVGANDGFVDTIYDQLVIPGKTLAHATLNTNNEQWRIVSSGALDTLNNLATARHVTSNAGLYVLSSSEVFTDITLFFVVGTASASNNSYTVCRETASGQDTVFLRPNTGEVAYRTNGNIGNVFPGVMSTNTAYSFCITHSGGTINFWRDNVFIGTDSIPDNSFSLQNLIIGAASSQSLFSEILIFNTVLDEADRYTVNKNIDDFYGI
jgi:hypothetical protein